jgi:hypothetical protein
MASDAWLSVPCRLISLLPPPALRRLPCAAVASTSPRCRRVTAAAPGPPRPLPLQGLWAHRGRCRRRASDAELQGPVQNEEEVVDSNVLPYCSIDRKTKKTIGEMEQEFLGALQVRLRHFIYLFWGPTAAATRTDHLPIFTCLAWCGDELNRGILYFLVSRRSITTGRRSCRTRSLITSRRSSCGKEAAL